MSKQFKLVLVLSFAAILAGCSSFFPDLRPGSEINTSGLERALMENPDNVHARFLLGRAALENGYPKDALREFNAARRLEPAYEEAWDGAGIALMTLEKYGKALDLYTDMNDRFPNSISATEGLASAAYGAGELEKADTYAQAALELDPASAQAMRILGDVAYARGDYAAAVDNWQAAVIEDGSLHRQLDPLLKDLRAYVTKYGTKAP